jgi:hypothetical protein
VYNLILTQPDKICKNKTNWGTKIRKKWNAGKNKKNENHNLTRNNFDPHPRKTKIMKELIKLEFKKK